MTNTKQERTRYSEADLKEFKTLIEGQLEKAMLGHQRMQSQLDDIQDQVDDDSDMVDESNRGNDLEMLYMMLGRSRKHIQDLENALLRIKNKSYGICVVSGELIDKRRLLAVPATTKSLLSKEKLAKKAVQTNKAVRVPSVMNPEPKIISKVISKSHAKSPNTEEAEELNDFDTFLGGMAEDLLEDFDIHQQDSTEEE